MTSRQTTGTDARETGPFYNPIFLRNIFFSSNEWYIPTVPCCFKFSPDEKIVPCNRQTLAFWYDCATISTLKDLVMKFSFENIKLVTYIFKYLWKDKTYQSLATDSLIACWSWEVASISAIKTFLFLILLNYENWKCFTTQGDIQ